MSEASGARTIVADDEVYKFPAASISLEGEDGTSLKRKVLAECFFSSFCPVIYNSILFEVGNYLIQSFLFIHI